MGNFQLKNLKEAKEPLEKYKSITSEFFGCQFGYKSMLLDERMFPEVTFENSPQEMELKLVSEIVGVAESPLKTFPRVNEFEVGASYRR